MWVQFFYNCNLFCGWSGIWKKYLRNAILLEQTMSAKVARSSGAILLYRKADGKMHLGTKLTIWEHQKRISYLVSMVPENINWRFWCWWNDTGEVNDAALVHMDVGAALNAYMGDCKIHIWRSRSGCNLSYVMQLEILIENVSYITSIFTTYRP